MTDQESIIQAVRELVAPMVASLDRLESRMGGLESRMGGLESRMGGLEARFDGLEARFDGLEARFDGLEARFDAFVHQVNERFERIETRLDKIELRLDSIEHRLSRVEINQIDAIERLKLLEQQVTLGFDGLKEDSSLQRKSVYTLHETTQRHKTLLEEEIDQLRERVAALENKQAA